MKRFLSLILLAVCMAVLLMPLLAQANGDYVKDTADFLYDTEETILGQRSVWMEKHGVRLLFYTDPDGSDRESVIASFASEWEGENGIIVYGTPSDIELRTFGTLPEAFSWEVFEAIKTIANERRSATDYYQAMQSVVVNIVRVLEGGTPQYDGEFFQSPVWDMAGFLTESEVAELEETLDSVRQKHHVDVAVVTTDSLYGDTAMEAADDIFDYCFYGFGRNADGILLYINRDPRDYWITTCGEGEGAVTDNGIQYIENAILPHLKENDYSGAIRAFAESCDMLLSMKEEGHVYNERAPKSAQETAVPIALAIIVPALIAYVFMRGKLQKMNTVNRQLTAKNYVTPGSMDVTNSKDIFLYSHVTRTKKPESSSSGGSHTSSSGRSHGGGGGRY